MAVLFDFRASFGLEHEVAFMVAQFPVESSISSCSDETYSQLSAYENAYYANIGDAKHLNYYPMLDNLTLWIDSSYQN